MKFIAVDLGASSGRVMLAVVENEKIDLEEIHRFANGGTQTEQGFLWNHNLLFEEILKGFSKVVEKYGPDINGIAITSWGVDYVLLDKNKQPLLPFYHYRDERTNDTYEKIFNLIPKETIFTITGIQFMRINTICQLFESLQTHKDKVKHFLMIPDYFTFLLTGEIINEYTNATTTQMLDAKERMWSKPIMDALEIPRSIFLSPTHPGKKIGTILSEIAEKTGLSPNTPVFSSASHDTGAAVAGTPNDQDKYQSGEWAYLSSGTWSLIGVELTEPNLSNAVAKYNFTNEGGVCNTIRLLKNTTGFWILEECLKTWKKNDSSMDWGKIIDFAKKSTNTENFIDINHPDFVSPSNMIETINSHYREKYAQEITSIGDISNMVFTSMVTSYQKLLHNVEDITKIPIEILHVVGGGAKNDYLNQLIVDKLKIPVVAGPSEAATIGNILMQAIGNGIVKNLIEGRKIVRDSFDVKVFNPKN